MRFVTLISVLLGFCGCATTSQKSEMLEIPLVYQPLFSVCMPTDGDILVDISTDDWRYTSLPMTWNIPDLFTWNIQWSGVLGEKLLDIQRRNEVWIVSDSATVKMNLDVSSAGFVRVNGLELPLLDVELPCLFSGRWPVRWKKFMRFADRDSHQERLVGADLGRIMTLTIDRHDVASANKSCAVIEWGGVFGFFRRQSRICFYRKGVTYRGELTGPGTIKATWVSSNDTE